MLSPARGVYAGMRRVRVRHACGWHSGLSVGSATYLHSVAIAAQTRAPIANPLNSAQPGGILPLPQVTPGSVQ